ncbi:hypothetical protein SNE40_009453 [Patella caerulea]|uniref:Uncharacterized protein n=1 Tax=Patella caerulea TaxID=87958 RepID=A0AAN8PQ95_PATCE
MFACISRTSIQIGKQKISHGYYIDELLDNVSRISVRYSTTPNKNMTDLDERKSDLSTGTHEIRRPKWLPYLTAMKFTQDFNEDKTGVVVHHPGLSFESYDRDGNPSITSIMKVLMSARAYAYHNPIDSTGATFLDYAKMTDDCFTFMASSEIEVEKMMYDIQVVKTPLDVKVNLGNIGKSSLNSVAEVTLPFNGMTLLRNVNQVVVIDKLTRKPKPVPDWWKEKYSGCTIRNQPLIIPKLVRPNKYYTYKFYVAWSDTDNYNHTNSASYSRFAINAIQNASSNKYFNSLTQDKLNSGIKKIQMSYIGESAEGDLIEASVWEASDKPIAYCQFLKEGKAVFQCSVLYNMPVDYPDVGI